MFMGLGYPKGLLYPKAEKEANMELKKLDLEDIENIYKDEDDGIVRYIIRTNSGEVYKFSLLLDCKEDKKFRDYWVQKNNL